MAKSKAITKADSAIPVTVAGALAKHGAARNRRNVIRMDTWRNQKNGFGGSDDPMFNTQFWQRGRMQRAQLDAMYIQDWISRKVVDAPPQDATRRWLEFIPVDGNLKAVETMNDEFQRLDVRRQIKALHTEGRLYGGSVMVVGAFDGQDVREPLEVDRIRAVSFLNVVDRFLAFPLVFNNDPNNINFGQVELYQVTRVTPTGSQVAIVHASRIIRMDGEFLPALVRVQNFGWGISALEKMRAALADFGVATQSGAAVLQDFVSETLKLGNLEELITSCDWDAIEERIAMAKGQKSMHGLNVIGDDEEITREGQPITGLPDLIIQFRDNVAGASDIAKSRLFSASGGALAGDGGADSDLRNYYDEVSAFQKTEYAPRIRRLIDIIGAPHGITSEMVDFEFLPLWEPTEKEKAETDLVRAQTDQIYLQNNVVSEAEVAVARFAGEGISTGKIVINEAERKLNGGGLDEPDDDEIE